MISYRSFLTPLLLTAFISPLVALADPVVNQTTGIAGYQDEGHRNPVLTVSHEVRADGVQLLADAKVENSEFLEYPIQFSFFVNRELFKTQIRSPSQGNAVGVLVPSSFAAAPFNYSVLATVLHPNRQYSTYFEGTTYESQLATSLSCEASVVSATAKGGEIVYKAENISTLQSGNNTIQLSFLGKTTDDNTQTAQVSTTLTITADGQGSGTVVVTTSDAKTAAPVSAEVTGTSTLTAGKLTALSVSAADGLTSLTCETADS